MIDKRSLLSPIAKKLMLVLQKRRIRGSIDFNSQPIVAKIYDFRDFQIYNKINKINLNSFTSIIILLQSPTTLLPYTPTCYFSTTQIGQSILRQISNLSGKNNKNTGWVDKELSS